MQRLRFKIALWLGTTPVGLRASYLLRARPLSRQEVWRCSTSPRRRGGSNVIPRPRQAAAASSFRCCRKSVSRRHSSIGRSQYPQRPGRRSSDRLPAVELATTWSNFKLRISVGRIHAPEEAIEPDASLGRSWLGGLPPRYLTYNPVRLRHTRKIKLSMRGLARSNLLHLAKSQQHKNSSAVLDVCRPGREGLIPGRAELSSGGQPIFRPEDASHRGLP